MPSGVWKRRVSPDDIRRMCQFVYILVFFFAFWIPSLSFGCFSLILHRILLSKAWSWFCQSWWLLLIGRALIYYLVLAEHQLRCCRVVSWSFRPIPFITITVQRSFRKVDLFFLYQGVTLCHQIILIQANGRKLCKYSYHSFKYCRY